MNEAAHICILIALIEMPDSLISTSQPIRRKITHILIAFFRMVFMQLASNLFLDIIFKINLFELCSVHGDDITLSFTYSLPFGSCIVSIRRKLMELNI